MRWETAHSGVFLGRTQSQQKTFNKCLAWSLKDLDLAARLSEFRTNRCPGCSCYPVSTPHGS